MAKRLGVSASEMMVYREQGMTNVEIAKLLGTTATTVLKYIGKQPEEMTNANRAKQAVHLKPPKRKASIEDMRTLRENGMSNKEIAEALQVSYATVHAAIGKQPAEMTKKVKQKAVEIARKAKKQEKCEETEQNSLEKCENADSGPVEKCDEPVEEAEPALKKAPSRSAKVYQISNRLSLFAHFPSWYEQLHLLKEMAAPEPWRFKGFDLDPNNPETPILAGYLNYVFNQLATLYNATPVGEDGKYILIKGGWACFNTGLFTDTHKPIYATFVKNPKPGVQPWLFTAFVTDNAILHAHPLPTPPQSARPSLGAFQPELDIRVGAEHILKNPKNAQRLPISIKDAWNLPMLLFAAVEMSKQRALVEPDIVVRGLAVNRGTGACIDHYLLPLWLTNPDTPDLALCVQKFDGFYTGNTCIMPGMAYTNARNFGRPQAKWLRDLVEE